MLQKTKSRLTPDPFQTDPTLYGTEHWPSELGYTSFRAKSFRPKTSQINVSENKIQTNAGSIPNRPDTSRNGAAVSRTPNGCVAIVSSGMGRTSFLGQKQIRLMFHFKKMVIQTNVASSPN